MSSTRYCSDFTQHDPHYWEQEVVYPGWTGTDSFYCWGVRNTNAVNVCTRRVAKAREELAQAEINARQWGRRHRRRPEELPDGTLLDDAIEYTPCPDPSCGHLLHDGRCPIHGTPKPPRRLCPRPHCNHWLDGEWCPIHGDFAP